MPCLVLRGTTEWVEAVESSDGPMVVVGLDADAATAARTGWPRRVVGRRRRGGRAAGLALAGAGAADAIVAALEATPP